MKQVKVLTLELAKRFLKDWFSIAGFTQIEDEAAVTLANHKGILYLGLTSMSDKAAEALANHGGVYLSLNGLTSLSDSLGHIALTEKLANYEGNLYLDGLASLSDNAAETLAKHKGNLYLRGLTSLGDNLAEVLAKHKGDLYLWGQTSLSDNAAEALAKYRGKNWD